MRTMTLGIRSKGWGVRDEGRGIRDWKLKSKIKMENAKLCRPFGRIFICSRLRTVFISRKDAQKGALFVIYAPKCSRNLPFPANLLIVIGNWLMVIRC